MESHANVYGFGDQEKWKRFESKQVDSSGKKQYRPGFAKSIWIKTEKGKLEQFRLEKGQNSTVYKAQLIQQAAWASKLSKFLPHSFGKKVVAQIILTPQEMELIQKTARVGIRHLDPQVVNKLFRDHAKYQRLNERFNRIMSNAEKLIQSIEKKTEPLNKNRVYQFQLAEPIFHYLKLKNQITDFIKLNKNSFDKLDRLEKQLNRFESNYTKLNDKFDPTITKITSKKSKNKSH